MSVVVIGLNHNTAPLDLLERMSVSDADLAKALADVCSRDHVNEAVVLSTCNRTEVYAAAEKFHGAYAGIRDFLAETAFLPPEAFSDHLYVHHDEAAAAHLFAVAAGIDSAVLGESEILGQVGAAWARAQEEGASGRLLNLVFRHALEVGKRVRTETAIGRKVTSVSQAAVAMADAALEGGLAGRRILVLGAGDMGEGMAVALAGAGVGDVLVVNRTWDRGVALAGRVGGRALTLDDLPDAMADVDVLLTSTGATSMMVERSQLAPAVERRDGRPLLIVDIAVPRDVDPSVADLAGVTLLDMDDLRAFADVGVQERRREVRRVQTILDEELDRYLGVATAREAAPLIASLWERAGSIKDAEVGRLQSRLAALEPRERETVEALAAGIVAKLLHEPTVRLKEAAGTLRGDRLAESLRDLFDL